MTRQESDVNVTGLLLARLGLNQTASRRDTQTGKAGGEYPVNLSGCRDSQSRQGKSR